MCAGEKTKSTKMARKIKDISNLYIVLFLFTVTLSLTVVSLLFKGHASNRDVGAYILAAKEMTLGKVLYREIWEHKPPIHLFVNFLGYSFGGIYGVDLLQGGIVITAFGILYLSLRKVILDNNRIIFSLFFAYLVFAMGFKENVPELEILFFQACLLFLSTLIFYQSDLSRIKELLVGILGAGLFFTKFNFIGAFVGSVITIVIFYAQNKDIKKAIYAFFLILLGFSSVVFCMLLFLHRETSITFFFDQVIVYNFYYSNSLSIMTFFQSLLGKYAVYGLLLSVIFALLIGWRVKKEIIDTKERVLRYLLLWGGISFFVDVVAIVLTGRFYLQYLLPLVIYTVIFFVFLIKKKTPKMMRIGFIIITTMLSFAFMLLHAERKTYRIEQDVSLARDIEILSSRKDRVFVWGAEPQIYLYANRTHPTKYSYIYPIITKGYNSNDVLCAFFDSFADGQPLLIIDTSSYNSIIPPLNGWAKYSDSVYSVSPLLSKFIVSIRHAYIPVDSAGGAIIWKRQERWENDFAECK